MIDDFLSLILDLRHNFRVADAVDIGVVALFIYAVLLWLRRTASRSVLVGASLLFALYVLADAIDMHLTTLAFQTMFAVLVVMLVVLFQEEIRRALERVANWNSFRPGRRPSPLAAEIDTIVGAVFAMAVTKTGALIVVRGHEPLDRHADGGVELSGRISRPLLLSIFDPGSIGHDGAVIIDRDRIEQFAAHLPLSTNEKVIRGRGTRHSAGLGLSECSDALAIIVSEERGVVSVAEQGKLKEMAGAADLKTHLDVFLESRFPSSTQSAWRVAVTHHMGLKLLAFALAIAAWFALAFDTQEIQTSILVPIEYRNASADIQLDDSAPAEALVLLSGSERSFRVLDRRALKISIDLKNFDGGDEYFRITEENLKLPSSLTVRRIRPNEIRLRPDPSE